MHISSGAGNKEMCKNLGMESKNVSVGSETESENLYMGAGIEVSISAVPESEELHVRLRVDGHFVKFTSMVSLTAHIEGYH